MLSDDDQKRLDRLRRLAVLLDTAFVIPVINVRFGLDPLVGLIPGVGDMAMLFCSVYILIEAARFGVPKRALGRMLMNILIDTVLGAVPVFGDFFDVSWKSNIRNVELLERCLDVEQKR